MNQPGNRWGDATFRDDPTLIDAPLSSIGKQHTIEYLQQQLDPSSPVQQQQQQQQQQQPSQHYHLSASILLKEIELIVVSPLTRCLETYQYGIEPILNKIRTKKEEEEEDENSGGQQQRCCDYDYTRNSFSRSPPPPPMIMAHPLIRERVYTSSDTGRPISILQQEFPNINFDECCCAHPSNNDQWWYTGGESGTDSSPHQHDNNNNNNEEWRPYGQGQWYAVPGEPQHVLERRLDEFDLWLSQRPEHNIMIVSHWGVLKHLSSDRIEWANAQVRVLQWTYCTRNNTRHVQEQHP
jgi:broad specificity phosphatase PhoE